MDVKAYLRRQKYWLDQAKSDGRGVREFFCIIGRTVTLFASRLTAPITKAIGNRRRASLAARVPIDDKKIFFYTFQGSYTCNPKYITEELLRRGTDCDIVWACAGKDNVVSEFPDKVRTVKTGSREFYRELVSSKIWVMNSTEFLRKPVPKKQGQYMIQTWHGSLGIKRFGDEVVSGSELSKSSHLSAEMTDVLVSNSAFENDVYKGTYWPDNHIEMWGHARNDILTENGSERCKEAEIKIRTYYNIQDDVKTLLYAPTFRDDHLFDNYFLDVEELIDSLKKRFNGNWNILVRFHPSVRKEAKRMGNSWFNDPNVIDVTQYPDIQELMVAADIALTDYSSWIYDFILTGKPGFIYAPDMHDYESERSFYYPLSETPFPVADSFEELKKNIDSFDKDDYNLKVAEFLKEKGCIDDGHASERAAEYIEEILSKK